MNRKSLLIGLLILTTTISFAVSPTQTNADSLSNPYDGAEYGVHPGKIKLKPGTYSPGQIVTYADTDGMGVRDSTTLRWKDKNEEIVDYAKGAGVFTDGRKATLLHYSLKNKTTDNGYLLLAESDILQWSQATKGSREYIAENIKSSKMSTSWGDSWNVVSLVDLITLSGGLIDYIGGSKDRAFLVNPDGKTVSPAFKITPTPPPTSKIDMSSVYNVGDRISATLVSNVFAANTNWHGMAVKLKGPGVDRFLAVKGRDQAGAAKEYGPAKGTGFYNLVFLWGGGSAKPDQAKTYRESVAFDTTGYDPGSYRLELTLYDAVGRPASNGGSTGTISFHFELLETGDGGSNGGGGSDGTGACLPPPAPPAPKAPFDDEQKWISHGNGDETLQWTHHTFKVKAINGTDANGCPAVRYEQEETKEQKSYRYTASMTDGEVTGLTYDPGVPGNMWLPIPVAEWNAHASPQGVWGILNAEHGWTGFANGGPYANQISSTALLNGVTLRTYGIGQGTDTPWVYARPGSDFGFRIFWSGSPNSIPTGGAVTYKMTNPDGASTTWTKPLVINSPATLYTEGTDMKSADTPPAYASVAVSQQTAIPRHVVGAGGEPVLADWSLSEILAEAQRDGARIDVTVNVQTPAGAVTFRQEKMVTLFSYPAWYQVHLSESNLQEW